MKTGQVKSSKTTCNIICKRFYKVLKYTVVVYKNTTTRRSETAASKFHFFLFFSEDV